EQHRERLRPRGGAVELVAGEHRPRDDRGDQHQRGAGEDDAAPVERVENLARERDHAHSTAWMRLIRSAKRGPYLSHTGFTAAWNGALSAISMISMTAALALSTACFS